MPKQANVLLVTNLNVKCDVAKQQFKKTTLYVGGQALNTF